ncbi:MAG: GTP-binding protein [Microthrixaceae bacterium]
MELLRFATAGSVDDGKSTLIRAPAARLSRYSRTRLEAVSDASLRMGLQDTNLALLTDGLRAERSKGITIDVAYRYFATPKRKFIIADTPGHIQYRATWSPGRAPPRPGHRADRCPQGRARAVAPARLHRLAAADPAPRPGGEQDGSRRLQRGALRGDRRRDSATSPPNSTWAISRSSPSRRSRATTW